MIANLLSESGAEMTAKTVEKNGETGQTELVKKDIFHEPAVDDTSFLTLGHWILLFFGFCLAIIVIMIIGTSSNDKLNKVKLEMSS